jgi:hypothetical protein
MANNELKYLRLDATQRTQKRLDWNRPLLWPLFAGLGFFGISSWYLMRIYQRRTRKTLQ